MTKIYHFRVKTKVINKIDKNHSHDYKADIWANPLYEIMTNYVFILDDF